MKRSQVNAAIRHAQEFLREQRFTLPPFAAFTPEQWRTLGPEAREIADLGLGWDVTDFGLGDFDQRGAVLFTLRNGLLSDLARGPGRVYCEKIIVMTPGQTIMHHFHKSKTEDIINRAGGRLELVLHKSDANGKFSDEAISFNSDGVQKSVPAGGVVVLEVGESITLEPGVYHQFRALEETVLVGEVSTVNDDANDNFFFDPIGRFTTVEDDEAPYRLLVTEYTAHYPHATKARSGY
jgi:D-lyxose ketol-isomerase